LIFASEDDILEKYLRYWRKFKTLPLKIQPELITSDLRAGCSCSGCFGACVKLADKYNLLPTIINHKQMESERINA
jgi:hypothetical protein